MRDAEALTDVRDEFIEATSTHPKFNSAHEGLAVAQEEFEELKAEVFKKASQRDPERLRTEAKHLAAMAIRFMVDCT